MKYIKSLLVLTIIFTSTSFVINEDTPSGANEVKWRNWNDGYKEMLETGKIGLIDIYTDWCGWCKRMDKDTYAKQDIIEKIDKHFVPIKFNPEQNMTYLVDTFKLTGPQLKQWLLNGGGGYPTTVFMVPSSRTKFTQSGYMGHDAFDAKLDEMIKYAKSVKK